MVTSVYQVRQYGEKLISTVGVLCSFRQKNDFVFQCLFSAKNEEITKDFISALLNEKIESIKINDTKDLYRELPDDKFGILD